MISEETSISNETNPRAHTAGGISRRREKRVIVSAMMIVGHTVSATAPSQRWGLGQSPRRRPDLLDHKRSDCLGDKGGEFLVNRELADGQFKGLNVRKTA